MKDNETFIREIYEKASLCQKKEYEEKKKRKGFYVYKKYWIASGTIVMASLLFGIGLWQYEGKKAVTAETTETASLFNEQIKTFRQDVAISIEVVAMIQKVEQNGSVGTATIQIEKKNDVFQEGTSLEVSFNPTWLDFTMVAGEKTTLVLEQKGDGTFAIVGGKNGI